MLSGFLSPRHGAYSVCGWRSWPSDMEGSRKGVVFQRGIGREANNSLP